MPQRPRKYKPATGTAPKYTPPHLNRKTSGQRGYDHRWRKARESYLADNPLCVLCYAKGKTVAATVVDHIVPHKGDQGRFWDVSNWRAVCAACHNRDTAKHDGGWGNPIKPK